MRIGATALPITLFLLLSGCSGPDISKQAQNYCMKNSPDDYRGCLKHRYQYLKERKALMAKHREDRNQCEEHAMKVTGQGSGCFHSGNSSTVAGGGVSASAGMSRDVDCDLGRTPSRTEPRPVSTQRSKESKTEVHKQCMLARGWADARRPSEELRLLSREFGFEREEYANP
jgi:hypothetical protein